MDIGISTQVTIRDVRSSDYPAVRQINRCAFGQEHVADLVDALRLGGRVLLSLAAFAGGRAVGHILYCRQTVGGVVGAALGPLAVLPEYQRQGIGSQLVRHGNARLKKGCCQDLPGLPDLPGLEVQLDAAAELWGLSDKELAEIRRSLAELE